MRECSQQGWTGLGAVQAASKGPALAGGAMWCPLPGTPFLSIISSSASPGPAIFHSLSSLPVSLSIPAPSVMTLLIIHGSLLQPVPRTVISSDLVHV